MEKGDYVTYDSLGLRVAVGIIESTIDDKNFNIKVLVSDSPILIGHREPQQFCNYSVINWV